MFLDWHRNWGRWIYVDQIIEVAQAGLNSCGRCPQQPFASSKLDIMKRADPDQRRSLGPVLKL
jgi:hypothetical protein